MQNNHIIYIFIVALIALSAFGVSKFVICKANKNSDKNKTSKKNNLVLQSGVIGLCLGAGVGTALKDLFSETAILFVGLIGAIIGVTIGIIIKRQNKST